MKGCRRRVKEPMELNLTPKILHNIKSISTVIRKYVPYSGNVLSGVVEFGE